MEDTRRRDKVKLIRELIREHISSCGRLNWNFTQLAEAILAAIEQVETEYHNRWEEMRLESQMQEKPD